MIGCSIRALYSTPGYHSCRLLSDTPRDEVVRKRPRLFFVERDGIRYAVVEQSSDDAIGTVEWCARGPIKPGEYYATS